MKNRSLSVGVAFLIVSFSIQSAHAFNWRFWESTTDTYLRESRNLYTGKESDLNQLVEMQKGVIAQSEALVNEQAREQSEINTLQTTLGGIQKEMATQDEAFAAVASKNRNLLLNQVGFWGKLKAGFKSLFGMNSKEEQELEDAGKALNNSRDANEKTQASIQTLESNMKNRVPQILEWTQKAKAAELKLRTSEPALAELRRRWEKGFVGMNLQQLEKELAKDALLRDIKNQMDETLDAQKEIGYDAKLFMADFDALKLKKGMSDLQLAALRLSSGQRLNNTLVGEFTNEQIKAAMAKLCDKDFSQKCAKQDVQGISEIMDQALKIRQRPTNPQVNNRLRQGYSPQFAPEGNEDGTTADWSVQKADDKK